jgi:hypothetical protein
MMLLSSRSATGLLLLAAGSLFRVVSAQDEESLCTRSLSDAIVLDDDGLVSLQQVKNTDEGTFTMRLTYTGGLSWVGIGINLDGRVKMTPTQAIIGRMETSSSVAKYRLASDDPDASGVLRLDDDLQTSLYNASFTQDPATDESILEFTTDLSGDMEVTDDSLWVFAVGLPDNTWVGQHRIVGGFRLPLTDNCLDEQESGGITLITTEAQGESLYLAHGICMALAWGLLAPLAIGAAYVRQLSCLSRNANWLKVHMYLNVCVVLLTIVGFALAVAAANQNGEEEHFTGNSHTKIGLAVFVLVLLQAPSGYFRPAAAKKPKEVHDSTVDSTLQTTTAGVDSTLRSSTSTPSDDAAPLPVALQKSKLRVVWEIGHRLMALVLVGLAWSNCTSGITLYVEMLPSDIDAEDATAPWIALFWGITGGICFTILTLRLYLQFL